MATTDASDKATAAVAQSVQAAAGFSELSRAEALLDIVDELDANLVAAGEASSSEHYLVSFALKDLRREVDARLADGNGSSILPTQIDLVESGLRSFLDPGDLAPSDQSTARSNALRRLDIWRTLGRSVDDTIDFSAIVTEVCDSAVIREEAASIGYRVDVLKRVISQRRDAILGHAQPEIDTLAVAQAMLARQLLANLEARRVTVKRSKRSLDTKLAHPAADAERAQTAALDANVLEGLASARQVIRGAIEREARTVLSEQAKDLKRTQLRLVSAEGLAQVVNPRLEVSTEAASRLAKLLRRMRGGSVGIAGPRGVGKSTIIRRFCDGRESIGDRPLLSVAVAAPVIYDSRDFMLHLFTETCRRAGAVPAPEDTAESGEEGRPDVVRVLIMGMRFVPLLAAWLALVGAATLVTAIVDTVDPFFIWGVPPLLGAGYLIFLLAQFGQMHVAVPTAVLLSLGGALILAGILGATWSDDVPRIVIFTGAGVFAWLVAARIRGFEHLSESRRSSWPPEDDTLHRVASVRLEELRYQQTVKTGVSGKLSVPIGIELGASAERSLARHPMTFPEVVGSFARFLELACTTHDVLIAIDELDKLEPHDETATRFLNDLKAAFGVPNTYFLVSVSEDAMSRFERRGLPFRDVFDSTFDEILRVPQLSLSEARRLLAARVVGLPHIYVGLCYVLSGGVPRDLIRTARRVVEANEGVEEDHRDNLEAIVGRLMADELEAKALAVEQAALALHLPAEELSAFLDWIDGFRTAAAGGAPALLAVNRTVEFQSEGTATTESQLNARTTLSALAAELGTYGCFVATVLGFFKDSLTEAQIQRATLGVGTAPPELELLALARMSFSINAGLARKLIERFSDRPAT